MARRPERVAEQIKEEVSLIVAGDVHDPRVAYVTVTDAQISPDLRHAKIFVSVLGNDDQVEDAMAGLRRAAGFIRSQLGAALRIKKTPELHFVFDDTARTAERIEELLTQEAERAKGRELGESRQGDELAQDQD